MYMHICVMNLSLSFNNRQFWANLVWFILQPPFLPYILPIILKQILESFHPVHFYVISKDKKY